MDKIIKYEQECNEEICRVCKAHKKNYKEAMGRECEEEHGPTEVEK